ncbi:MAG: SpoIID/LytB domain-containing protein [Parachlamydiales bacterium]|nr:SpoIID/LytB domain-containing protein [Parachlamydiales bacterium]
MKKALSFLLFIFFMTSILNASDDLSVQLNHPESIQVLLAKNIDEALLEAKGSYVIYNPKDGMKISSSISGKRFMVKSTKSGIKWGEVFPGIHQIYIVPKKKNSSLIVNGIEYDGSIAIIKIKDKINIINDVDVESFLKATLAPQFPYPLDNEVMAAIAIAARTTAYSHVKRNKDAFWHISAEDTTYQGNAIIDPDSVVSNAVDRTKHIILVHTKDGVNRPFAAIWTENSAGKTASFQDIFRKDWWAPNKGVEAPHALLNREESKWSYTIDKKNLANLLSMEELKEIETFTDSFSGKTYALKLNDSNAVKNIDFITFQNLVGKDKIISNDMTVSMRNGQIYFTGYGKGYGVGLCLHSAKKMALNGDNAAKILSKFFPDTFLLNLSAMPKSVR